MSSEVLGVQHRAYHCSDCHPLSSIIALLPRALGVLLVSSVLSVCFAHADTPKTNSTGLALPPLGNSVESDRPMLREISDQHIFDHTQPTIENSANSITISAGNSFTPPPIPATTVWQYVQQSQRLLVPDNKRIASYRAQYRREALWISKILNRATPYVGHIVEALDRRYLPVELALLPAIESGYQPDVISAESAAGIWQIVPLTATEIGIQRTLWFDGRADIMESTVAAIDYLSYLNAEFHGDWLLTLAAYNAGPGRVRSAIRRNTKRGRAVDFWSLQLPTETEEYVPKFLALLDMLRHDKLPEFEIPRIPRGDAFEVVDLKHRASLDKLAALSGINELSLRRLNTGLVHGVTPPQGPHRLYVGKGQSQILLKHVAAADPHNLYTLPAVHVVVAGDSVSTIAQRYGLSRRQLRNLNALSDSKILIGQELAVRHNTGKDDSSIEYVVSIGDTLSGIAQRFSVQLSNIRDAEGKTLASDLIHPGVRLSIALEEG